MSQPKTALEWFEEARAAGHEWADAAIENLLNSDYASPHIPQESAAEALGKAFLWTDTEEGWHFWDKVHDSLLENP